MSGLYLFLFGIRNEKRNGIGKRDVRTIKLADFLRITANKWQN